MNPQPPPAECPLGTLELFDPEPLRARPAGSPLTTSRPPDITADRWRTMRQRAAIDAGLHPLSLAVGFNIPLHPDAARDGDPTSPGLRCGSCAHRQTARWHDSRYPKCTYADPDTGSRRRWSHGPGTDCRAWWPGCPQWTEKTE